MEKIVQDDEFHFIGALEGYKKDLYSFRSDRSMTFAEFSKLWDEKYDQNYIAYHGVKSDRFSMTWPMEKEK